MTVILEPRPGWLARRLSALAFAQPPADWLPRLLLASDFAHDVLRRDAGVRDGLEALVADGRLPIARWLRGDGDFAAHLRRFRRGESLRLIARDLLGIDDVEATLTGASDLADTCIIQALAEAEAEIVRRHGVLRDAAGSVQRPVVFALGKLGGQELNFSSDVDLVFAYAQGGPDSDGPRSLAADAWHGRVVQRCGQLLGEITADGFVYRVDLRLRPFGQSGKPALPFAAMEQYFQREGRDWERYAWLKARTVAGDVAAGDAFLDSLRPFVYRRYLDYNSIDALAEMKAQIDLEVQRQDLVDDIKLGPGGIREIEFLVQVVQLVRGGREPALRQRGLLAGLAACAQAGYVEPETAAMLADAYRHLRRIENRLQMLRDAQTQALPEDEDDRARIAWTLDYPNWSALRAELDRHRHAVRAEFAQVLAPRREQAAGDSSHAAMLALWRALADRQLDAVRLESAGVAIGDALFERLRNFGASPSVRALSARARERLDRLMAAMLQRLHTRDEDEDIAASAIVDLLQVLLRRSNYLALLAQQPAALDRLFDLARVSRWLVRHLIEHPVLLDDVFDPRSPTPPDQAEIATALAEAAAGNDSEPMLAALAETKTSLHFRLGLATIERSLPAVEIAARLAAVASGVLRHVLRLALADTVRVHGWPAGKESVPSPDASVDASGSQEGKPGPGPVDSTSVDDRRSEVDRCGLALIGYGSLGGGEMGFASDLDLVFVFDKSLGKSETTGRSPVEGQRFYARIVQKLIAYLAVPLPGGRLYEIDARLRPDGAKGLLVTSLDAYAEYQRERAWTWEQQALVRAGFVTGDGRVGAQFQSLRESMLCQQRDPHGLREAVVEMRERLRRERDRSRGHRFDLKQGPGGLVDLEFAVQYLVLRHAAAHPELTRCSNSAVLLRLLAEAGLIDRALLPTLLEAQDQLLHAALSRTLDDQPRIAPLAPRLAAATRAIENTVARVLAS